MDCTECKKRLTRTERAAWACGWVNASEHIPSLRPFPEAEVCPGYTIAFPEVIEAARILAWANRGALSSFVAGELPPAATDAVDILDASCKEVEREAIRESSEKMSRG